MTGSPPPFEIIALLKDLGADVGYRDPYIPERRRTRKHDLRPSPFPARRTSSHASDVLVVSTAHPAVPRSDSQRRAVLSDGRQERSCL